MKTFVLFATSVIFCSILIILVYIYNIESKNKEFDNGGISTIRSGDANKDTIGWLVYDRWVYFDIPIIPMPIWFMLWTTEVLYHFIEDI